jgi:copper(I)-binding protein
MSVRFASLFAASATIVLASCSSGTGAPANIQITDAWARATIPGQTGAAAYLTIVNTGGTDDRLVSVSSPIATGATLHSISSEGGVMRMRMLSDGLSVPAGATVKLQPSGNHAMLTGVSKPLAKGSSFPLNLRFERSGERQISVQVLDPSTPGVAMEGL